MKGADTVPGYTKSLHEPPFNKAKQKCNSKVVDVKVDMFTD